jgi:hypothetical protein
MTLEELEGAERPKAVTIIGRLWLILAVLFLCKALVNLAIWEVLQPDAPSFIRDALAQTPRFRFARPLLTHITAVMTVQALWWVFVGVAAFGLLRLRPWARVAIMGVCSLLLVYSTGFEVFWAVVFPTLPARGGGAIAFGTSYRTLALVAGLAAAAVLSAGLIWMIVLLRGPRVRAAFQGAGKLGTDSLQGGPR